MPQKSNDQDQFDTAPVPQEQDDELEMAEEDDDFEDDELDDETGDDEDEVEE
jgi:hypothetical protein